MPSHMGQSFQRVLELAVAVFLCALMFLTGVDVGARYFFNHPVAGAFELTEMLMGAIVYIGLVLSTVRKDHIAVDLIDRWIAPRNLRRLQRMNDLLSGVVMAIGALGVGWQARSIYQAELHSTMLAIPLWPVAVAVTAMVAVTAIVFLLHAFQRNAGAASHPGGSHD
jgi:TRAP-type C4-dicarboxylate transport system, small permease component